MGLLDDYEELASAEREAALEAERLRIEQSKHLVPPWAPELIELLTKHRVPTVALYAESGVMKPLPPKLLRSRWLRRQEYRLVAASVWSIRGFVGHVTGDFGARQLTSIAIDPQGRCWLAWSALTPGRQLRNGELHETLGVTLAPALRASPEVLTAWGGHWESKLAAVAAREVVDGTYRIGTGDDAGVILVGPV